MTTAHYLNLQALYKWKKEEDKGRIWDRAEEPPYLAQTSVLWQHYGNIIFSLQPKELDRLTASIYIQRRPFGVTWNTERVCINTEQYLCFPVIQLLPWNRKHCAESLIFMLSICREAFTDQWFYRIVDFFPPAWLLTWPGERYNWINLFSSLYKILSKILSLNTLAQSLMHQRHAQIWSKYRRMPHERNKTNPGLFARSSSCRCNHAK